VNIRRIDTRFALTLLDTGRLTELRAYLQGCLPPTEETAIRERYDLPLPSPLRVKS
jgi:hypothetical protein